MVRKVEENVGAIGSWSEGWQVRPMSAGDLSAELQHLPCTSGASRLDVGPALFLQFHHAHYA